MYVLMGGVESEKKKNQAFPTMNQPMPSEKLMIFKLLKIFANKESLFFFVFPIAIYLFGSPSEETEASHCDFVVIT